MTVPKAIARGPQRPSGDRVGTFSPAEERCVTPLELTLWAIGRVANGSGAGTKVRRWRVHKGRLSQLGPLPCPQINRWRGPQLVGGSRVDWEDEDGVYERDVVPDATGPHPSPCVPGLMIWKGANRKVRRASYPGGRRR